MAGQGISGYTPQQIASAYGISNISFSGVTGNGAGQTIAIVEAYHDPNIQSDLATFDSQFGISAPPSFTVDNLGGSTTNAGWAMETALDVEWAHAIAPQANIVLVEASSASVSALMNAVSAASNLPGVSVVSMSWGTNEYYGQANSEGVFNTPAGHTNETFVAASGDSGAWSGPTFPSVSPNVLAVGGTSLTLGSGNTYGSETGWSDSTGGFSGLDSRFRYGLPIPSYQVSTLTSAGLNYGLRTTPDVSFNADPSTGVTVYDSVPGNGASGWLDVGGTSAAAPAWAGLVAIADQGLAASGKGTLSTTQLLTDLYSLPSTDFNDITTGFNGYSTGPGYDLVTGLGTPKANLLVPGLLAANGVTTTSSTPQAAAASHQATNASVAHVAAVASSSSGSVVVAGTIAGNSTPSGGLAALPVSSTTSSATASSSGQAQVTTSSAINVSATGPSVGLGQGLSSSQSSGLAFRDTSDESSPLPVAVIDDSQAGDPTATETPMPAAPAPAAPAPESSPKTSPAEGQVPESPATPDAIPSASDRMQLTLDRPVAEAGIARLESAVGGEGDSSPREHAAGGSAAGLVAAGAVVALGHRVVLGRNPRRRPLTAAFRLRGR
jgi:subtilase family serine protease